MAPKQAPKQSRLGAQPQPSKLGPKALATVDSMAASSETSTGRDSPATTGTTASTTPEPHTTTATPEPDEWGEAGSYGPEAEETAAPPPVPKQEASALPQGTALLLELARLRQQELKHVEQARQYQELLEEHEILRLQRAEDAKDSYEAGEFLRRELLARNAQIEVLHSEMQALQEKVVEAARAAEEREELLQQGHQAAQAELQSQLAAHKQQLDSLAAFGHQREALEEEVHALRQQLHRLEVENAEEVAALQRKLSRKTADAEGLLGGAAGEEEEECGRDVRRVLQHNKKMAQQMKAYAEEAEELQRGVQALEVERTRLQREAALRGEMEQQYALRGTLQAREIKDANSKIVSLERGMAAMAEAFQKEKAALVMELRGHLEEALAEQSMLRRMLKLRTKELGHVRKLAQEVLLQRSDVEAFLLSSIQQVRLEIARRDAAGAVGEGSRLQLEEALAASSKVDIRDLTWEDRECILRQLFVKINTQRLKPHAEELPPAVAKLRGAITEAGPAGLA